MKVHQLFEGDLSPYDLALTKKEQMILRDRIAKLLKIDQKRVAYQQITAANRHYLTVFFVAEVPDLDEEEAAFRARLVAKDATAQAEKMFNKEGTVETTVKVIYPNGARAIQIKHKVTPV